MFDKCQVLEEDHLLGAAGDSTAQAGTMAKMKGEGRFRPQEMTFDVDEG